MNKEQNDMEDKTKEVIANIIKALKEITSVINAGVHGYYHTTRIRTAIDNAEKALEKLKE